MGILHFCDVVSCCIKIRPGYRIVMYKKLCWVPMYEDLKNWHFNFFCPGIIIKNDEEDRVSTVILVV
jgi:hypothetical protein